MLIGSGMIAKTFCSYKEDKNVLIFASGVSNSKEEKSSAYKREKELLVKCITENPDKIIVYFSTCSIYDKSVNSSTYVLHKKEMEDYVQRHCENFYVFRLPQVVGKTDSPTLVNYLWHSILTGKEIIINKHSSRNLLHADELFQIVKYLIDNNFFLNEVTNIASANNVPVLEIVLEIEKIVGFKAKYTLIDFGEKQYIDISKIKSLNQNWGIFEENYTQKTLTKYSKNLSQKVQQGICKHMPLISIVTVVYNGKSFLEKTIQSILSQTYSNIEYIIIDGASTDGTIEIIKRYESQIDVWISEKDNGIYDAMNKGAALATGDFINFMNADDIIYSKNAIEKVVENMGDLTSTYYTRASIISDSVFWIYPPMEVQDYIKWLKLNLPNHQTMFFPKSFYKHFLYDLRLRIGADDDYKLFALENTVVKFIDITFVQFKRGGISSDHQNYKLFIQRIKESYIRNYKHKRWIRFLIDPFKLILMFLVHLLFGEEKFLYFIKMIVKWKK